MSIPRKDLLLVGTGREAVCYYGPPAAVAPTHEGAIRNALDHDHLPPVLAGPIVRKTSGEGAWIWLATSLPVHVEAWATPYGIGTPGESSPARGSASSFKVAHHLHITLVKLSWQDGPTLPYETVLLYNLRLTLGADAADWWFVGDVAFHPLDLAAIGLTFPSFYVPSPQRRFVRFLHSSCRKLHGAGEDAVGYAAALLHHAPTDAAQRPASWFLTGDQIYSDDVHASVLAQAKRLGRKLLGRIETAPNGRAVEDIGARAALVRANGFTVDESVAQSHLIGFNEFAAVYLLSWSPDLAERYATGVIDLAANRQVRLALANYACYMIFDDHEITDDWNLTFEITRRVAASALGSRLVANGLAAYWAFQGCGNDPDGDPGPRDAVCGPRNNDAYEAALWTRHWGYTAPLCPGVVLLDTRTQRELEPGRIPTEMFAPGLLNAEAAQAAAARIAALAIPAGEPLVIVSPAPFIGYDEIEGLQKATASVDDPFHTLDPGYDPEAWSFHRRAFVRFLDVLLDSGRGRVVILSGDVHYGFAVAARFSRGMGRHVDIVQLTSSATRNEMDYGQRLKTRIAGLRSDDSLYVRVGWNAGARGQPFIARRGDRYVPGGSPDFEIRWRNLADRGTTLFRPNNVGLVSLDFAGGQVSQILNPTSLISGLHRTSIRWADFDRYLAG